MPTMTWERHGLFWLMWIGASTIGPAIAGFLLFPLLAVLFRLPSFVISMGLGALISGGAEWLVLRRYVGVSRLWIGVGAIAVACYGVAFWIWGQSYPEPIVPLLSVGMVVFVVGRGILLRRRLPWLPLWALGNLLAWSAMLGVGLGVGTSSFEFLADHSPYSFGLMMGTVCGITVGIIRGGALALMLLERDRRHARPSS